MSFEEIESLVQARGGASLLVIAPKYWADSKSARIQLQTEKLGEQKRNIKCSPGCDWVLFRAQLKNGFQFSVFSFQSPVEAAQLKTEN
jgi:hypothetical protein